MSILLDAVSRAKQEQQGEQIDPVLSPRLPMNHVQPSDKRWIYAVLLVLLTILVLAVVWRLVAQPQAVPTIVATPSAVVQPVVAPQPEIALAGKVSLPMAKALPALQPAVTAANTVSSTEVTTTESVVDDTPAVEEVEPIILGAQANDKGMAMLQRLRDGQMANDTPRADNNSRSAESTQREVDDELVSRFQAALSEVERRNALTQSNAPLADNAAAKPTSPAQYPSYGELPAGLQLQVPEFNIIAHMYATDPSKRWLNVDGQELQEGDKIKQKLTIKEIRANDVVLEIQGQDFRVPAI
ncbi:general secretion pathway protein GspB [Shewanella sp.]|uniref:general secretion pathway protein GspB n=1 Tax=Shewanella sp. TaxID=50422 RepID=UPI003A98571E